MTEGRLRVGSPIPFNLACLGTAEIAGLVEAASSAHISGNGPFARAAEVQLSRIHFGSAALLMTSCTHALELSARLLNLQPGDEVIVPAFTFVTSASAFAWNGSRLVFADVEEDTLNMAPEQVEALITPRTRAIVLVHYGGVGARPDEFAALAGERGLPLIEDNAHGLGGQYRGRTLGTWGALSALSFHETKNVTCGEGGALIVNDPSLVERAEILREKGTDRSRFFRGQVDKYTWVDLGSSWVLSDVLAALLVPQLERLAAITETRSRVWLGYASGLAQWADQQGVRLPVVPSGADHPAHLFHLRLPTLADRDRFIGHMAERGIRVVFHYQCLSDSPMGATFSPQAPTPVARQAADTLVRLPLFLSLTQAQVDRVIEAATAFRVG